MGGFGGAQLVETERGIQKMSKLDPEGLVKGLNGKWIRYFHARKVSESETMIFHLKSGKVIECVPDQRILTVHGFAHAKFLRMGEYLAGENLQYKPPKPSEREVREDIDDLYEDLPVKVKEHYCIDKVTDIRKDKYVKDIYSLYVPRWHSFQLNSGVVASNCDELNLTAKKY